MKGMKWLLLVDWCLWGILIVGFLMFFANAWIKAQNSEASIPGLSDLAHWRHFGWLVLVLILIAVPLGLMLALLAARAEAIVLTSKVPEVYHVTTPQPNQPNVNITAPDNKGVIIGSNQGQVNIQTQRQPQLSLSKWKVVKLDNGTYQSQATLISDIPATFPRISFIARSPSLISLQVSPNGGVGFGVVEGTVDGGKFMSFANVTPPYLITAITKEQEQVNLQLSDWNPLGG